MHVLCSALWDINANIIKVVSHFYNTQIYAFVCTPVKALPLKFTWLLACIYQGTRRLEILISTTCIQKPVNTRLQGPGERNCRVPLRIPKFPHPLSYGGHHSNICVHHCFHVDGPQLLRPTGDPSHPVWLHIKSQSHSKISEPLWALELIPGEIIKVTLTWVA